MISKNQPEKLKIQREGQKLLNKWRKSLRVITVASYGWHANKAKYSKNLKQMSKKVDDGF